MWVEAEREAVEEDLEGGVGYENNGDDGASRSKEEDADWDLVTEYGVREIVSS